MPKLQAFAEALQASEKSQVGIKPLRFQQPALTIAEAYQIQLLGIASKVQQGDSITGKKIGLTSVAMQQSLGVAEPDYGHLLTSMAITDGVVKKEQVSRPRVEAEFAFVLKEELKGPNVTSFDVVMATDYVVPALEVVDSRIADWNIQLVDTIADNASSGCYVLGENPLKLTELNLKTTGLAFYKNQALVNTGIGAACLGDPVVCVAWLANKLAEFDRTLQPGDIILSGALSAAVPALSGDQFLADFGKAGKLAVRFE